MHKPITVLALSLAVACGHASSTGGGGGGGGSGGGGGVARNEDGVPLVDLNGFVSDFVPNTEPLAIDAKDPKTWVQPGTYGLGLYAEPVSVDGKSYLGMARFCGGPKPKERADCLALQKRVRIERLAARLELVTGTPAKPKAEKALPKPIRFEDEKSGRIEWLTLCDDACLAKASELGGVETVTLEDIQKAINAKVKAEQDKKAMVKYHAKQEAIFADAKPENWDGDGPWWVNYSARLVPYIDGEVALIGVAAVDPSEGRGPALIKAARARARAELAKAMLTVVKTHRSPGDRTIETEADLDIYGSTVIGATQNSAGFWALALCDHQCLSESFAKSEIELPLSSLQPGPVEP